MNQHFNSNRVIFVDVKETFQGTFILSRDESFDYMIVWFWTFLIYNDLIYIDSYLFFSFRYFIPSFFLLCFFVTYLLFIYLLCVLHVTETTPEGIPSIITFLRGCCIKSTSEIDVNLSHGLCQSYENSVKYQSILNSFLSGSCVCFILLFWTIEMSYYSPTWTHISQAVSFFRFVIKGMYVL